MNKLQQLAYDTVLSGKNVLLTGPAGTGKSYTLQHIMHWARTRKIEIGVTASTGLAALLIKGRTIHSFLGIGLGTKSASFLAESLKRKNKQTYTRLRALKILLIDEISMLDADLLTKISEYLCLVRQDPRPFGGVQLVLCGDFCQLPPVSGSFCFTADIWGKSNITIVMLEELVRQDKDARFQKILQELRWGLCSRDILALLKAQTGTVFANGIIPTRLYSVNVDVDKINKKEFDRLVQAGAHVRTFTTSFSSHPSSETWGKSVKIPESVDLCIGAQVLVTWNLPNGSSIVNGTRGVIVAFDSTGVRVKLTDGTETVVEPITVVCEDNDKVTATFMPLRLAYAISIHKSQGMTLDAIEIDLGDSIFEYGQAYTALSRARNLESVRIIAIKSKSFKTHPLVKEFYGKK